MPKTYRSEYRFTVKEGAEGQPWLMAELLQGEGLPILERGFLGLKLVEGTSLQRAEEIARLLFENIDSISYTEFHDA